jgi:hypothetical protein
MIRRPVHRDTKHYRRLLPLLVAIGLAAWLGNGEARAAKGDSQALLFIGTTTFAAGGATTFGTTFGGSYGFEVLDDLLWSFGGAFSSTDASETATDAAGNTQAYKITAVTSEFRTGLTAFFNRRGAVIPFVGGGLSFMNYDIDYTYPGSEVGKTSGTGPGAFVGAGVELRLTRSTTLILRLTVQEHIIKTETGETTGLTSGGLVFSLRIST